MKQKNGFTLIELIVAIAIAMMIVGFGSVALNDFNEKQKISGAVKEIVSNLRLARNYAVTNQLSSGADVIQVDINGNGLFEIKDTGKTFLQNNFIPKGIKVTIDNPINFSVTDGRLTGLTMGTNEVNIGVSGVEIRNIRIDESGLIYEK